jgi:phosphate/sulfate permease
MFGLESGILILFIVCIVAIFLFEFINGFHDTANAVATVIYTHTLKPQYAVILSGALNFLGVMLGGVGVAMGIVELMPIDVVASQDIGVSVSLILAVLISAIVWNLGTWYYGIPCSSSHTLIGSIVGGILAFSLDLSGNSFLVPWKKAEEIGFSLLISPLIGFSMAFLLMLLLKRIFRKRSDIFHKPDPISPPPFWIRLILILTCSGVSYAHGSNDGQKGVGLTLLALICFAPGYFALNDSLKINDLAIPIQTIETTLSKIDEKKLPSASWESFSSSKFAAKELQKIVHMDVRKQDAKLKSYTRTQITKLNKSLKTLTQSYPKILPPNEIVLLKEQSNLMKPYVEYAPKWVILMISLALGTGTMIGWKRIVVTIGSKIGKDHLTYAQGASSELIAASTIGISTLFKLPVSTTHILSSGVAGTMVADKGLKNLQKKTLKNIALAWVLTLPVCVALSFGLFYFLKMLFV